ncbi:Proline racemase [Dethiosulfatibacter aminovorans DSM 17477]|uniref:Proline racemase n=1 Tax=Dethiosulfatibacter aminovorans DSM 17477 TaxID=1121476 RepID=A0A1M6GTW5_9FIRM|nr:proline racemase family protein [Dethiosulfatibacter aminovorans]SHJ13385.1 Proline racemase [Dethiosulfatibacter aminovorans DSM 17477]
MKIKRMFTTVDTHMNGTPVRTVTGGLPYIPGKTVVEKTLYLEGNADWIRKMLIEGPRGNENQSGIILTEPCCSEADAGIIYVDGNGYENISTESIVGVSTVMIESGLVDIVEPYTYICLESKDGLIHIKVRVKDEIAKEVTFKNVEFVITEKVSGEVEFGGSEETVEEISGRAFITGMHTFTLDPEDSIQ